jgi:hypothetical protein
MTKEDQELCAAAAEHLQKAIEELQKLSPEGTQQLNKFFEQKVTKSFFSLDALQAVMAKLLAG